jgi:hypothetical protein
VVLNKSDTISHQQLMKVYGALLWSLGKVINTPEVTRVYIGSFWDQPLKNEDTAPLLEMEMADLLRDLAALPRLGAVRKINDIVKRIRQIRTHVVLLNHLREAMPAMFGKDKKKKELLDGLGVVFRTVMKQHNISVGDFPDMAKFKRDVELLDFTELPKIKGRRMQGGKRLEALDEALNVRIPALLNRLPGMNKP